MINCLDTSFYVLIDSMIVVGVTIILVLAIQDLARGGRKQRLKPDEIDQKILELHARGLPKTRISIEVFGHKGGNQSKKIEEVLSRFGANDQ